MTNVNHARAVLDHARRQHLAALGAAVSAGTPAVELLHDAAGFYSAAGQLLALSDEATRALPSTVVTEPAR